MAKVKCKHCGRKASDKEDVCPRCGTPLVAVKSDEKQTQTDENPSHEQQAVQEKSQNRGKGSDSFLKWCLYGLAVLAVLCGVAFYVWHSGTSDAEAGYESVFDHAVEKVEDGQYLAKWTHQGTQYDCNFVIEDDVMVFAQVELAGKSVPLYAKIDHGEHFKAILPDRTEEEFYLQFSLMDGHGYMTVDGIEEDINVELLKRK